MREWHSPQVLSNRYALLRKLVEKAEFRAVNGERCRDLAGWIALFGYLLTCILDSAVSARAGPVRLPAASTAAGAFLHGLRHR